MASLKASWNVNVVVYSDFDSRYLLYFLRRQKAFFFKITLSTFQFFHLQKCFYKKKIDTEFQVTFKITLQLLLYTCWTNKIKRIGFFSLWCFLTPENIINVVTPDIYMLLLWWINLCSFRITYMQNSIILKKKWIPS